MALVIRSKATGAPATLEAGELATNWTTRNLLLGDGSSIKVLLGGPVNAGAGASESMVWNAGTGEWESYAHLTLLSTGPKVAAAKRMELASTAILYMGDSGEFQAHVTSGNYVGTIADAADFNISDGTGVRLQLGTDGNLHFRGTTLFNNGSAFNTGFERERVLSQATYEAIGTPDANTIYHIFA